jgi:hypothetical protein
MRGRGIHDDDGAGGGLQAEVAAKAGVAGCGRHGVDAQAQFGGQGKQPNADQFKARIVGGVQKGRPGRRMLF